MTDHTQREPDAGPWCIRCEEFRSPRMDALCPVCADKPDPPHPFGPTPAPTRTENDPCNRNATPTSNTRTSDTTATDVSAAPTGMRYPVADSTTHTTLLSIARRWMSL